MGSAARIRGKELSEPSCPSALNSFAFSQSSTAADTLPLSNDMMAAFERAFRSRLGTISGRSVKMIFLSKTKAAAMPTNPVPAPSSSTVALGERSGMYRLKVHSCLARRYEEAQVLSPRLSAVMGGSYVAISTTSSTSSNSCLVFTAPTACVTSAVGDRGIANDLVIAPIADLPLRSLKRCDAASQTCSFSPSSSIQARGLDMILVRYCGTPSFRILRLRLTGSGVPVRDRGGVRSQETGWKVRSSRVARRMGASGLV